MTVFSEPLFLTILTLMLTGALAGLLAGLLGLGGGVVLVPALFFGFQVLGVPADVAMPIATGTSLACIIPTATSSILAHRRLGTIDFVMLKRWGPFVLLGAVGGSSLASQYHGLWLTALFGLLALFVALNMLFRASTKAVFSQLPAPGWQSAIAGAIGAFSVMVGIGGGSLSVPLLTACNYPPRRAIGTSTVIGLLVALPGALIMLLTGHTPYGAPAGTVGLVNLLGLLCIFPVTIVFAPLGAKLAQRLDNTVLKRIFAGCLLLTGMRMLLAL